MTAPAAAGDTIFALSSGAAPAAIGIVRVSGSGAGEALQSLAGSIPVARMATLARLREPSGALLDQALILWFPGPGTATGEDLAELHLHGGRATIAAVLEALAALPGLRLADPGEFTRRALANGRMDLAQVEGLADLLQAETELQRRSALRMADGGLSAMIHRWDGALLDLAAEIEAVIEFAEEEQDVTVDVAPVLTKIATLAGEMRLALSAPPAERLRDGVRIVIAGPVNAGKSSLLNALAGREAAIATEVPGTTRDLIEVPVVRRGVPLLFVDSAGLRDTDDTVERIGIDRAFAAIEDADVILWLGNPGQAPRVDRLIQVHGQCDRYECGRHSPDIVAVSAVTGEGLDRLWDVIFGQVATMIGEGDRLALNARQRSLLIQAESALTRQCARADDWLVTAEHVQEARRALGAITGRAGVEQMLDQLFGRFCIGK